jgi:uncharacterized protein
MISASDITPVAPTAAREREPILDVLRGFAILGILLVNVQFMRGTDWMTVAAGDSAADAGISVDTAVQFAIGWLASGKFLSSLAILFGIGAAMIAARAHAAGESPRPLLARRYAWLMLFGLAHMLLLYPGDILFIYGLTGTILLAFVNLRLRTIVTAAAALLAFYSLTGVRYARLYAYSVSAAVDEGGEPSIDPLNELRGRSIETFGQGSYADIVSVHAEHALTLQGYQVAALPWILALFMIGYAVGRSGFLTELRARRGVLRLLAIVGIGAGLAANIAVGVGGPLGAYAGTIDPHAIETLVAATLGQALGAPLLAIGYLCALTLYCLARGPIRPLAAVGRMALTAYLLQSALALSVIAGLRLYDNLTTVSSLLVVAGIWAVLLVLCPWWLRHFQFGPVEWLWRSLSYGRIQGMSRDGHRVRS